MMSKLGALSITKNSGSRHTATVIFFHGSGAAGDHMKEWVQIMANNFVFPHIKILFPTAPLQPYTPAGGLKSNVWFDRLGINPKAPEVLESLARIEVDVKNLIKSENENGIKTNRIIVGGFSMGGALALHTAYRWEPNLAGVFAFSSFLNDNSIVYKELKQSGTKVPLLQIHGNTDDLVDLSWAQETFEQLKANGVQGKFHIMERTLEQQWRDEEREELNGAKELLNAILRYRHVMETDSETILNVPINDQRSEDERTTDEIVQAVAHKVYEDLKSRLKKDIISRARPSITTEPLLPEENSIEGEMDEETKYREDLKLFEEDREIEVKEAESAQQLPSNLKRYWRRRDEEYKEEQFYRYLLREGSVPPYFKNVLGGAIWWEMNNATDNAVIKAERRKMKCVCAEEASAAPEQT